MTSDLRDELDETFNVTLTNPLNASIADPVGLGTIIDDDAPPTVSVSDVAVAEGNEGTVAANFTVSLSAPSSLHVSVDYATVNGAAAAPADYAAASGTLNFAAGETTKSVTVNVNGDTLDEINETYNLNLSNPSNATLGDNVGLGTITDDDPLPALSVNDIAVTEGDGGTVSATFTVTVSPVSGRQVSVDYATANESAIAGSDYQATTGTLILAAGEATKTITVPIIGDTLDEAAETFRINLTNAPAATIVDGQGTATITDNDPPVGLSVDDVSVLEGNSGTTTATFTLSLAQVSGQTVTVDFATENGTATAPARLRDRSRRPVLCTRRDDEDGDRDRQRRRDRRGERDLHPQPLEPRQCNGHRRRRCGDDHERRRLTRPFRLTTSRSPRTTLGRSTPTSPSRSLRPAARR